MNMPLLATLIHSSAPHAELSVTPEYASLVYRGYWFSPEREVLQEMIDATQRRVTGTARLKLHRGSVQVAGRKSPHSLYSMEHVTFEKDDVYNQADATGFIRLNALRLRLRSMRESRG